MADKFCIEENLVSSNDILSPSRRFKLIIHSYKTKENCWNYTKGVIIRLSDGTVIAEIIRNYSAFHHSFFTRKNGDKNQEWLCTGKTYLSQCFVNLDTGEIYDNSEASTDSHAFCWASVKANLSGTILAVEGCIWGGPYEIEFYDFSDPTKGWPIIKFNNYDNYHDLYVDDNHETQWLNNETFQYTRNRKYCPRFGKEEDELEIEELEQLPKVDEEYDKEFINKLYYRAVVEKIANEMHFVTVEDSEDHKQYLKNLKEFDNKV
ncbi:Hypothetical protein HVR_LOCUS1166 [uncultured virus]|nr:Hypothetical protein HVR_LOCUS1166 [uncultured virus]